MTPPWWRNLLRELRNHLPVVIFVRDRAACLFRLVLERRNPATALPNLNVVPVNQLLGVFFGALVFFAEEVDTPSYMAVRTQDVGAVLWHLEFPWDGLTALSVERRPGDCGGNSLSGLCPIEL